MMNATSLRSCFLGFKSSSDISVCTLLWKEKEGEKERERRREKEGQREKDRERRKGKDRRDFVSSVNYRTK